MKVLLKVKDSLLVLQDIRGFHSSLDSLVIEEGEKEIKIIKKMVDVKGGSIRPDAPSISKLADNLFLSTDEVKQRLDDVLKEMEQQIIFETLANTEGNEVIVFDYANVENAIAEELYEYGITLKIELIRGVK